MKPLWCASSLKKYVHEGFEAQRLSRWLYHNGYLNRKGTNFANTTIIKMLKNIMYVGILRSGGNTLRNLSRAANRSSGSV